MTNRLFTDAAQTGAAVVYSNVFGSDTVSQEVASAHLVWTGTPSGTFTVWASNKPEPSLADDTDWVDITTAVAGITNPAGAAGKLLVRVPNTAVALKYRVKYTNSASTGVLQGYGYAPSGR